MGTHSLKQLIRPSRLKATIAVAVCIGFVAGQYTPSLSSMKPKPYHAQGNQYDLLARRILIENPSDIVIDFRPLQTQLEEYIAQNNLSDKISLQFEYLPTGSSIGLSEDMKQVGASLLKLPLTMSVYKEAEKGRINLDAMIPLQQDWLNNSFGDLYKKGVGYQISPRSAAKEALTKSDNTAALLLFDQMTKAQNTNTPNLLGFIDANYGETQTHEVLIDSRSYASILKCLYFSCLLSKDHSQELLGYLVQSTAQDRLTKYIPDSTRVAHKIGTFGLKTQSDCGIFYLPQRNYVLCVMIDEEDPSASETIARISEIVYKHLTRPSL